MICHLLLIEQNVYFLILPANWMNIQKMLEMFMTKFGQKNTSKTSGDDRLLPDELRNRVNAYIDKRSKVDPEEYKKEIEKSTTFNALVRQEIRKGNI